MALFHWFLIRLSKNMISSPEIYYNKKNSDNIARQMMRWNSTRQQVLLTYFLQLFFIRYLFFSRCWNCWYMKIKLVHFCLVLLLIWYIYFIYIYLTNYINGILFDTKDSLVFIPSSSRFVPTILTKKFTNKYFIQTFWKCVYCKVKYIFLLCFTGWNEWVVLQNFWFGDSLFFNFIRFNLR